MAAVDAAGNVSPLKTVSANTLTIPVINHQVASETSTSIFLTTQARTDLSLRWARGMNPGSWLLSWDSPSPGGRFTVESADSISAPVWRPVEPVAQWPASITQLTIDPSSEVSSRFYRVIQAP